MYRVLKRLVKMENSDDLGAVVRVDALHGEEVFHEGGGHERRHVEHASAVSLGEGADGLARDLEGGGGRLVERSAERIKCLEHLRRG